MKRMQIGSINYVAQKLENYRVHGDFFKRYHKHLENPGNYIRPFQVSDISIRVKLKKDFFIVIHSDGWIYLVDTMTIHGEFEKAQMSSFELPNGNTAKGIKLMPWSGNNIFFDRLESWFKNPDKIISMALNRLSPSAVAKIKIGRRLVRDANGNPYDKVRIKDMPSMAKNGFSIGIKTHGEKIEQRMSAKRKG